MEFMLNGNLTTVSEEEVADLRSKATAKGRAYLSYINDEEIRELAREFWLEAPDYFFVIPASSSGKYHWAKDIGGLFDHVLMAMHCAFELSPTFGLTEKDRNLALAAVAGHDCLKYGIDYDTRYYDMHPFLPRSYYGMRLGAGYNLEELDVVFSAIERHMGCINDGEWTSVGRVRPETPLEQVVHLADFMASRKNVVMTGLTNEEETE